MGSNGAIGIVSLYDVPVGPALRLSHGGLAPGTCRSGRNVVVERTCPARSAPEGIAGRHGSPVPGVTPRGHVISEGRRGGAAVAGVPPSAVFLKGSRQNGGVVSGSAGRVVRGSTVGRGRCAEWWPSRSRPGRRRTARPARP